MNKTRIRDKITQQSNKTVGASGQQKHNHLNRCVTTATSVFRNGRTGCHLTGVRLAMPPHVLAPEERVSAEVAGVSRLRLVTGRLWVERRERGRDRVSMVDRTTEASGRMGPVFVGAPIYSRFGFLSIWRYRDATGWSSEFKARWRWLELPRARSHGIPMPYPTASNNG